MMRIMKRAAVCALALLLLFSLASCGFIVVNDLAGDAPADETETAPVETVTRGEKTYKRYVPVGRTMAEEYLDALPERDYGGSVFFITTASKNTIAPDEAGTTLSRLNVERNAIVSDRLNIALIFSVADGDTMLAQMKQAVASASYYTDLLLFPTYMTGDFRAADTLMNMRTLPFFDITAPYFNQSSSDMTSGGFATYAVAGDACLSPDHFAALYVNKSLLREAGIDDPDTLYADAAAGRWTYDELLNVTAAVNTMNAENGTSYHTVTTQDLAARFPDLVFASAGNRYVMTGTRTVPSVGFTARSVQTTLDTLFKLYQDPDAVLTGGANEIAVFSNGDTAFLAEYLDILPWFRDSALEWGVLPLPKGRETDEYRTLISENQLIFGIPANHTTPEMASITLSALNAASYGYIYEEYVNEAFWNILRDNDTANMLDLILSSASYDFALAFGHAYPSVGDATYRLIRSAAATNDLGDKADALIKKANEDLKANFKFKP